MCTREAYDESPSTAGPKKNLRAVVETTRKPVEPDIPLAAGPLALPLALPEVHGDEKATKHNDDDWSFELKQSTSVKKRLTTKSSTEKRRATFADKPVERRLTEITETEKDNSLMPVESVGSYLSNTVNTFFSDETGVEMNPWNDDFGQTKILTILDYPKEVSKGRQKELDLLRELIVVTTVKRSSSTLSRNTMLAVSSHDRNNHPECERIAIANDVHTAFLHADNDQTLCSGPPKRVRIV